MKKILFSASVLLCMTALTKAQESRVGINTTLPAATLDVTAKPTETSLPDGLLVPRMTLAVLKSKDGAYLNATGLTNQNGTLVFVTDLAGGTSTKTANVTSTGFYYYDGPNAVWVKVGAGAAPVAQRYEVIRGNVKILTTTAAYEADINDWYIVTKAPGAVAINLPDPAGNIGRVIYVVNNNSASGTNTVLSAGATPLLSGTLAQNRAKAFISDGVSWTAISFN